MTHSLLSVIVSPDTTEPHHFISAPAQSLKGDITVPGDKSISHRAIMLGAIATGITTIHGFLDGDDCLATLHAFKSMGVRIERTKDRDVVIHGVGKYGLQKPLTPLNCGNSGTSMRLLAGLLSTQSFDSKLIGDESLSRRPMERIRRPLLEMGADIIAHDGRAPLLIHGGQSLQGIKYEMPEASAQVKSCLLLAGMYAQGETCVIEPCLTRDHTERMLASFSYPVKQIGSAVVINAKGECQGTDITIPGDISSAAFFIVAATLIPHSNVLIRNVGINPTRTGLLHILKRMGANITISNRRQCGEEPIADLRVCHAKLQGIVIPESIVPAAIDEFPVLFVAAACAEGQTILHGAKELRYKESDRIRAMADGLTGLGVEAKALDDGIFIRGGTLQGGVVDSRQDHRIAMAFAIAGAVAKAPVTINHCDNVATSFPTFVTLANQINMSIKLEKTVLGLGPTIEHAIVGVQKMNHKIEVPVITLDGPSGTGKGTLCHMLAEHLGWHFLDSGAIYRVLAYAVRKRAIDFSDVNSLVTLAHNLNLRFVLGGLVLLDEEDISDAIRTERCGQEASQIAVIPEVRDALLARQRAFATMPGLVTDGRDMGTVVFPDAILKIFLYASAEERARRRYLQLKDSGNDARLSQVVEELAKRDERDTSREHAPLKPAQDAVQIDTTGLTIVQVFEKVLQLVDRLDL